MNISDRLDRIERIVAAHMEESGEIRTDLKWVKKSMWALIGALSTFIVTFAGLEAAKWIK